MVVVDDFFLELIATGSRILHHLDDFGEFLAFAGLQGSNYFLCHDLFVFVVDYLISL